MEPFRILVDRIVCSIPEEETNFKKWVLNIFDLQVKISGKQQYLENAISIYCKSVFDAIESQDISMVEFYE